MDISNIDQTGISIIPATGMSDRVSQFALGLTLAGAALGRSAYVQAPDGRVYHSALNIIIGTDNPARILDWLHPIIAPLKYAQAKRHKALAEMDSSGRERALAKVKEERLAFIQSDPMAAAEDLAYFDQQLVELQSFSKPMMFLECPPPGRVTLGLGRSADTSLLVVHDDLSFQGLLNASRMARGSMDLEAMAKSNRQELFDGGYLEGVLNAPVVSPVITTVMVATVEQVTGLLLTKDSVVQAFADSCLILSNSDGSSACPGLMLPPLDPSTWQRAVTRLLAARDGETRTVRVSKDAAQVLAEFERQVAEEHGSVPVEHGRFIHHIPRQVFRTALILHLVGEARGDEITDDGLEQAVEFIHTSTKHRLALVREMAQQEKVAFREKVRRVVSTATTPPSARDITRHIRDLKTATLKPVLEELVQAGGLEEQDGKYLLPAATQLQVAAG